MNRVPDLLVERLALGDLSPEREAEVRAALGDDAEARISAIRSSNREILADLPADRFAREVRARAAEQEHAARQTRVRTAWSGVAALAAAAVAMFILVPTPPTERTKGGELAGLVPGLTIYRQSTTGADVLGDGDLVRPGDLLQIAYDGATYPHGVIASFDGNGVVTLHFPVDEADSTALDPRAEVLLDHAYELDYAPGDEVFLLFLDDEPLDTTALLDELEANGPDGWFVGSDGQPVDAIARQRVRKEGDP